MALLELGESAPINEPEIDVSVFVVPPKPQRLAVLVEKTTELGVSAIHLVSSSRLVRSVRTSEIARLNRVAISAVEQSHRSRLPRISGPMDWQEMQGLAAELETLWVLDPTSGRRAESATGRGRGLVVGPEGGLDSQELADLDEIGGSRVCLGARILRTETAAIVGSVILMI
jgi:16S rRNA (uracil1498-N3)-methyltransferase